MKNYAIFIDSFLTKHTVSFVIAFMYQQYNNLCEYSILPKRNIK